MINKFTVHLFWVVLFTLGGCVDTPESQQNKRAENDGSTAVVSVAAAASTRFALDEIIAEFEKENVGLRIEPVYNASGKLTAQIEFGASYDVFLSADMAKCEYLRQKGVPITKESQYAEGALVVWTAKDNIELNEDRLDSLWTSKMVKSIAIADPVTAPYGSAAKSYLTNLNVYNKIENKLRIGSSIAQTTQYIESGSVDIGFTAKSVVLAEQLKGVGKWFELSEYTVKQGGAVLNDKIEAEKFFTFLLEDPRARKILNSHGYK